MKTSKPLNKEQELREKDYEFLLEHWKKLTDQLQDINKSLRDLVEVQQQTILKLQGIQTVKPQYTTLPPKQ